MMVVKLNFLMGQLSMPMPLFTAQVKNTIFHFCPQLAPYLSFVGLPNKAIPTVMIELQAKWVAKLLSGEVLLPTEEEMLSSVEELYQHMELTGWPVHHTHKLQQDKFEYENWLASQLGISSPRNGKKGCFLGMVRLHHHMVRTIGTYGMLISGIQEAESSN